MVNIKNQKGNIMLVIILFVFCFLGVFTLCLDYGNIYIRTKNIKYTMNRAVKASSLQIKEGDELAQGIFKIDEIKGKETFKVILADNLGLNETTLEPLPNSILFEKPTIKELEVINNTPTTYTSTSISKTYNINNPSVVAVIEFKVKGLFLSKTIIMDKLSSSQLTDIYN